MSEVHVKGLAELQKFLDQLPAKIEANIMRGALRAGMKPIRDAARGNIHSVSGDLARGLSVTANRKGKVVTARLRARLPQGTPANLPIWVEYGTQPHFISVQESEKPINARLSRKRGEIVRASMTTINKLVLKIGAAFVGPTVHHPGAKPHPFMRPALDSQAGAAVVATAEYIKKRLATKEGLDTSDVLIEVDS